MTKGAPIRSLDVFEVYLSPKTTWAFLEVTTEAGTTGLGEITFFGREAGVQQQLNVLSAQIIGRYASEREMLLRERFARETDRATQIVLSGVEQALIDIRARELGVSASELLGGTQGKAITPYANINRSITDRSPDGFAAEAKAAIAAGYSALKIAPFDRVMPGRSEGVSTGIDRVLAVRDAVGPDVRINVDCHARFNEMSSKSMIAALSENAAPFWVEQPLDEAPTHRDALRRVRTFANDRGIRIAGAESDCHLDAYRAIVNAECMDVLLPDIRMCGGVSEVLRIAYLVLGAGLEFSLHNPVGPVLDAISQQVASVAPSVIMLERTFNEAPVQKQLTTPGFRDPSVQEWSRFEAKGWGIILNEQIAAAHRPPEGARNVDFHAIGGAGQYA